jgi:hypothetical protein
LTVKAEEILRPDVFVHKAKCVHIVDSFGNLLYEVDALGKSVYYV